MVIIILCILFADDTTLGVSDTDLETLKSKFKHLVEKLLIWCSNNRLDINWSKTFCMFVANNNNNNTKIIDETNNIEINDYIKINVVDNFKESLLIINLIFRNLLMKHV